MNHSLYYLGSTGKGTDRTPGPFPIFISLAISPLCGPAAITHSAN